MLKSRLALTLAILCATSIFATGCLPIRQLRQDKRILQARVEQLRQDLVAEQQLHQETREKLAQCEESVRAGETALSEARESASQLRGRLDSNTAAMNAAMGSQQRRAAEETARRLERESQMGTELERAQTRVASLEIELLEARRVADELKAELDRTTKGLGLANDTTRRQLEALNAANERVARLEADARAATQGSQGLQARLAEMEATLAARQTELAGTRAALIRADETTRTLTRRLAEAESARTATLNIDALSDTESRLRTQFADAIRRGDVRLRAWEDGRLAISFQNDLVFQPATVRLSDAGLKTLGTLASTMAVSRAAGFVVVGHTDSTPVQRMPYPDNWELAAARACEVTRWLEGQAGIDKTRLIAESRAFHDPVEDNKTASGRRANRRVEVIFDFGAPASLKSFAEVAPPAPAQ